MDALTQAKEELILAEDDWRTAEHKDGNAYYRSRSERHYQQAAIYAAVAQAEQLKRIADALEQTELAPIERWAEVDGLDARTDSTPHEGDT